MLNIRFRTAAGCAALLFCAAPAFTQDAPFARIVEGDIATDAVDSFATAWGDLNGDGLLDVMAVSGLGDNNLLYFGQGGGTFERQLTGSIVTDSATSSDVAFADIDSDGDLDVYITNRFVATNGLYRNQGGVQGGVEGTFERDFVDPAATVSAPSECCLFVDFDGDDDLDLFVGNSSGANNLLFRNLGGIQFGVEGEFSQVFAGGPVTSGGSTFGSAAGDYDGDGDVDLFVVNAFGEDNTLYTNIGGGVFVTAAGSIVSQAGGDTQDAIFADIDGDTDLDLIAVNFLGDNFVYRNRGNAQGGIEGVFEALPASPLASGGNAARGVAAADWDADGDLDVAIATCCGQPNVLFETLPDWTFQEVTTGPEVTDGGYSNDIAFADADADGDLDVFVANSADSAGARVNFYYENEMITAPFAPSGLGLAGAGGVPSLQADGTLIGGDVITFVTSNAAPGVTSIFVFGFANLSAPLKGGTLYPLPFVQLPVPTDASGRWLLPTPWPTDVPTGFEIICQTWVPDVGAPQGFAATNGLLGTAP